MAKIPANRPSGGVTVTWDEGTLALGDILDPGGNDFGSGTQQVHVEMDQVGDLAILERHTSSRGNQVNFNNGERGDYFIQTDRPRDKLVLTFTPPVDAAVVQIAAMGIFAPVRYRAFVQARFIGGALSQEKSITGTTVAANGGAAFLGLQRSAAEAPIESLVFRVEPQQTADVIRRFAVNQVTALAASAVIAKRAGE
jgi:hypothetical protein